MDVNLKVCQVFEQRLENSLSQNYREMALMGFICQFYDELLISAETAQHQLVRNVQS